jgi:NADPH:quinone reductase-like Zn-dependent oxidoreductase
MATNLPVRRHAHNRGPTLDLAGPDPRHFGAMKAAILREHGAVPEDGDFPDPPDPEAGQVVVEVAAAAIHHLDIHKATGTFYTGPPPLPSVVGTDGVGRLPDGRRVYFDETIAPYGSMADRALAGDAALYEITEDVDDAAAAALGNTGLGAWMALEWRAGVRAGETVLVLGATGAVGATAVQAARLLGAGRVIAAARGGERLHGLGADATVALDASHDDLARAFADAAGGPVDVTIDTLWGEPGLAAMRAAGRHARHIQVGQLAGADLPLPAPLIRSKSLDVRGFSIAHPDPGAKREAHRRLMRHAARGEITVDLERVPLRDVASAWERQRSARGGPKLVLLPEGSPSP